MERMYVNDRKIVTLNKTFQVVAPINYLLDTVKFDEYYYSLDWHPSDHVSFIDNVQMRRLAHGSKVRSILSSQSPSPKVKSKVKSLKDLV